MAVKKWSPDTFAFRAGGREITAWNSLTVSSMTDKVHSTGKSTDGVPHRNHSPDSRSEWTLEVATGSPDIQWFRDNVGQAMTLAVADEGLTDGCTGLEGFITGQPDLARNGSGDPVYNVVFEAPYTKWSPSAIDHVLENV